MREAFVGGIYFIAFPVAMIWGTDIVAAWWTRHNADLMKSDDEAQATLLYKSGVRVGQYATLLLFLIILPLLIWHGWR